MYKNDDQVEYGVVQAEWNEKEKCWNYEVDFDKKIRDELFEYNQENRTIQLMDPLEPRIIVVVPVISIALPWMLKTVIKAIQEIIKKEQEEKDSKTFHFTFKPSEIKS